MMSRNGRWFAWDTHTGQPLAIQQGRSGRLTVTTVTRRLALRWPGGGFLWLHPAAVLVQASGARRQSREWGDEGDDVGAADMDTEVTRVPIPDPTRVVMFLLLGCTLLALVIVGLALFSRKASS